MSFVADLNFQDLQRLRAVVKKVHLKNYPTHMITDYEADKLIEALGPEVREAMIKAAVDQGQVK